MHTDQQPPEQLQQHIADREEAFRFATLPAAGCNARRSCAPRSIGTWTG
jgi:hypothetical protein